MSVGEELVGIGALFRRCEVSVGEKPAKIGILLQQREMLVDEELMGVGVWWTWNTLTRAVWM
jgi:hypothetical protein